MKQISVTNTVVAAAFINKTDTEVLSMIDKLDRVLFMDVFRYKNCLKFENEKTNCIVSIDMTHEEAPSFGCQLMNLGIKLNKIL